MPGAKLPRSFYARDTLVVARELIGMHLVHVGPSGTGTRHRQVGKIVETEAYQGPKDLAAHSARGRTARNEVMFGPPGHAYVYLIYGVWNCFNVVTNLTGIPHAVLVRAVEPVEGIDLGTHGPGLLCRAMHIDRGSSGADLEGNVLWIEKPAGAWRKPKIDRATRIGVDYAGDWANKPWRFLDRDSPYVSTVSPARRKKGLGSGGMSPR